MTPIHLWGAPKLSWDVPTQLMSGTQNGTGELQKSLAAGSGTWEISVHSRWYPRTWVLNLKWKAVTCKLSHQFPMIYIWYAGLSIPSHSSTTDSTAVGNRHLSKRCPGSGTWRSSSAKLWDIQDMLWEDQASKYPKYGGTISNLCGKTYGSREIYIYIYMYV